MFSQSFSEHSLNLVVREQDQAHCLGVLRDEFANDSTKDVFNLETKEQVATISVVGVLEQNGGASSWNGTGIVSLAFAAFGKHGTRVIAVAQAAKENSVSVCIPEHQVSETVRFLHRELGLGKTKAGGET
jgi:aspartokinase